jgi:magnesium-transporting ATPase (P-type)
MWHDIPYCQEYTSAGRSRHFRTPPSDLPARVAGDDRSLAGAVHTPVAGIGDTDRKGKPMTDPVEGQTLHDRPHQAVLDALGATTAGLSTEEAMRRLAEHGPNRLPEPPGRHPILRFVGHFNNVLIYVLLASSAVTGALGHWVDTGVILAVVIANAIIGFVQEGRAEQAMAAIRTMLAPHCAVLRGGQRTSIDAADLVPGDIVLVEAGDRRSAADRGARPQGRRGDPYRGIRAHGQGDRAGCRRCAAW